MLEIESSFNYRIQIILKFDLIESYKFFTKKLTFHGFVNNKTTSSRSSIHIQLIDFNLRNYINLLKKFEVFC